MFVIKGYFYFSSIIVEIVAVCFARNALRKAGGWLFPGKGTKLGCVCVRSGAIAEMRFQFICVRLQECSRHELECRTRLDPANLAREKKLQDRADALAYQAEQLRSRQAAFQASVSAHAEQQAQLARENENARRALATATADLQNKQAALEHQTTTILAELASAQTPQHHRIKVLGQTLENEMALKQRAEREAKTNKHKAQEAVRVYFSN